MERLFLMSFGNFVGRQLFFQLSLVKNIAQLIALIASDFSAIEIADIFFSAKSSLKAVNIISIKF